MNLKKSKKLSAKIYHLLNEMDHSDEMSSIERALVMKYVVNLYEELLENTAPDYVKPKKQKEPKIMAPKIKAPEKTVEIVTEKEQPKEVAEIKPVENIVVEDSIKDENIQFLNDLIQSLQGKDLADKLSLQPIDDIFKSMSINERIFTVNELFNGREDIFKSCLQALNAATNIEDAKKILVDSAVIPFNWNDPKKVKKVGKFVQLFYRKFI